MKVLRLFPSLLQFLFIVHQVNSQKQEYQPVRYATEGKEITLPCAHPSDATFLKWKFQKNGTDFQIDAAQVFPGNIPTIFVQFNTPPGRSELIGGNLIIHETSVADEGDYWCEISAPSSPTAYSKKYPVHVWVTPQDPQVTGMGNSTLTEYQNKTVARCSSQAGKPGSKIKWMNGTTRMTSEADVFNQENAFEDYLTDVSVDLKIGNPTRYDHNRAFSCIIEHPAYSGTTKVLNYTIKVMSHPINIRIWANLTSLYVYCAADAYPSPRYHWSIPGGLSGFISPELFISDLFTLPGGDYFQCTAFNGIGPNATARARVDDLRYPDGVPGWLGLDWWVWGVILGGIVLITLIIILVIFCVRRRKNAEKNDKSGYKRPIVKKQLNDRSPPRHPNSLPMDANYRTPDGREDSFDSRTPSPVNEHKKALIGGMYSRSQENVTLIPSQELRHSRDNVFMDGRKSIHASREQLDQVASHIQTLNQSWDVLSKSRQQLNDTQDELNHTDANLRQSREQLYHSQEALNRDMDQNYPYMDEGTTRSNERYQQQDEQYYDDQHDGYRQEPQGYDSRERQYNDDRKQGYDDRYRDQQQGYDTQRDDRRYGDYGYDRRNDYNDGRQYEQNPRYDDQGYGDDRQDYRDHRDGQYRQDGYNTRIV